MMKYSITQLHSLNPDELKEILQNIIKLEIDSLKENFEPKAPTEYLSRQQTATLLNIDLSTLWIWTKKGKLNAYSISSRIYYKRSEIEASLIKVKN